MNTQKYKFSFSFILDDISIGVYSSAPCFSEFKEICSSDIKMVDTVPNPTIKIFYEEVDDEPCINWGTNHVSVKASWGAMNFGKNFMFLALPILEKEKQAKGMITTHAASCSLRNNGIFLLGKEGSGKTSIVYKLCKNYNAKLIGNDITLIQNATNGVTLNNGTKFFFLRKKSVAKSMPELTGLFKSDCVDPWLDKIQVDANKINIQTENYNVPLSRAFYIHVDETQEDLIVQLANTLANNLHMNENFSRYIKGSCIALFDNNMMPWGHIASYDNDVFAKNRIELIQKLHSQYMLSYISGKSDEIAYYIANQISIKRH
jgi:gluconate kinase